MEHSSSSFSVTHLMIFPPLTHMHFAHPQLHLTKFFLPSLPHVHHLSLDCRRSSSSPLILILTAHHITVFSPHTHEPILLTIKNVYFSHYLSWLSTASFLLTSPTRAHFASQESLTPLSSFSKLLTILLFCLHMQIQI